MKKTSKQVTPLCEVKTFLKYINWHKGINQQYLLTLDFDGTLSDLVDKAEDATLCDRTFRGLLKLQKNPRFKILILSGRPLLFLEKKFGKNFNLAGEYGLESNFSKSQFSKAPRTDPLVKKAFHYLENLTQQHKGSYIEKKKFSYVWHYRSILKPLPEELLKKALNDLKDILKGSLFQAKHYNNVLEIKLKDASKKNFFQDYLKKQKEDHFIIAAGDDTSDEELFTLVPQDKGQSIAVGNIIKQADFFTPTPHSFRIWLEEFINETC